MGYTHGNKWSDDKVESEILRVIKELGIDHFPTHKEMKSVIGDKSLSCRISKTQGTVYWSEKLGIPIKYCKTNFGNKFELIAIDDIFENTMLSSSHTSMGHPYDIYVNNCVKVDVKVSKPFINNSGTAAFTFNLEKVIPTCDIYVLYCVDEKESVIKTIIIPSCMLFGQSQLGVGMTSKWDMYKDKWNIISEYNKFFSHYKYMSD